LEALRCRLGAAIAAGDLDAIAQVAQEARGAGAAGLADEADAHWRSSGGRRAPKRTPGLLTERETEVLACVAEGLTNREVADRLYISVRTVGAHLERCMSKLGVGTRGAAVHEARRQGILPGSG
jgi:DNA-binding NarL/FixJ family response regulator